jgi:hypothetical protein
VSIETKVEGNPDQITSLASWLTSSLEPAVSTSGDKLSSARKNLGSEWQGQTAEAIVSWLADAVSASDSLSTRITDIATAFTTYASILSSVRAEAECVRSDATAGGLVVSGTVVEEPKDTSDTKKTALYSSLSVRMSTAHSTLTTGQQDLRTSLASKDVDRVRNGYLIFSTVAEFARTGAPALWTVYTRNYFAAEAVRLINMTGDIRAGVLSNLPEGVVNPANARAANRTLNYSRALEMKGNNMLSKSNTYTAFGKGTKAARVVKGAGGVLSVVGFVVGYWGDKQEGESNEQAAVSNLAAVAAGTAAGAAIGSVVPGPGTAVGAVVGFTATIATMFVASTFTDEAVDSLHEDHKGIKHALAEGADAVVPDFISDDVGRDLSKVSDTMKQMDEDVQKAFRK